MTYCSRCGMPRAASAACCSSCGGQHALVRPAKVAAPVLAKRKAPIPFPKPASERGKGLRNFLFLVLTCVIVVIGLGIAAVIYALPAV